MFHVDKQLRNEMLEKYYSFDSGVVRDLLGKRLTEKVRTSLQELSNRIGIPTKSALRQFENIRRIYKWATSFDSHPSFSGDGSLSFADEHSTSGGISSYLSNEGDERTSFSPEGPSHHAPSSFGRSQDLVLELMHVFQLPKRLARKYARIVYIGIHQFELDKKKLQHLKYKDIDKAISYMIKYWGTLPDTDSRASEGPKSIELEPPNSSRRENKAGSSPRAPSALSISSPADLDRNAPNSGRFSVGDGEGPLYLANTDGLQSNPPSGSMQFPLPNLSSSPNNAAASGSSTSWYTTPTEMYPMLGPHPKIVSRLSQIKGLASSHKAELNLFVAEIRKKLGDWKDQDLASAAPDPSRQGRAESLVDYKFIKSFFNIGAAIGQTKDFKKIFSDLQEDIVQPSIDVKLSTPELTELFRLIQFEGHTFIYASLGPSSKSSTRKHLGDAWTNYITGLRRIALALSYCKLE